MTSPDIQRPILYLIDGHAVAYRQYFAMKNVSRPFTTSKGEPTGATLGFASLLLNLLYGVHPDYLAVSFDMGLSGREALYPAYKAQRADMEADLVIQMGRIHQLVEAFNIPVLEKAGYEADDIIGTIARQATEQGVYVRIITGDRDILQLLNPYTSVQMAKRQEKESDRVYDEALFYDEYGLTPKQLIDYKALVGDTSDNIPGVRGVGEKTALPLLQQYGNIETLYEHLDEIKGATQKKLIDGRAMAFLSKTLATIKQDLPVTLDLNACVAHDFDRAAVEKLFYELEFRTLLKRLQTLAGGVDAFLASAEDSSEIQTGEVSEFAAPAALPSKTPVTVIVRDAAGLQTLVETLKGAQAIAFDTETTSLDQMAAKLVGISLSVDGETGYYIPVGHSAPTDQLFVEQPQQLPMQTVLDALRPALTDPAIPKWGHNAIYDLVILQRHGIDVAPIAFDTMIGKWLCEPETKFLGLKDMAKEAFDVRMTEISALIGSGKKQITFDQVSIETAAPYAAADAIYTYQLVEAKVRPQLEDAGLVDLFQNMEMPLVPVIAAMERAGVALDVPFLTQLSQDMQKQLAEIEQNIYALSGGYGEFNINSPKQLNDVLFGKLGLPVEGIPKTTHGYSTAAGVLDSLYDRHEIIRWILEHREISKLKSTYVDALPALINPQTGRVHTSYNQTGTTTGRLSSSSPNLQNIPIRTESRREIRKAFIAPPGRLLLSVDYSQIELRVMAHISRDAGLLEAFRQKQDIHAATAARVFGVPLEQVTYEQRSFAKRVNFGLIYGMGAFRLARDSELTLAEANRFIDAYFQFFPGVKQYMDNTKRQAAETGYLYTLFGRRGDFRGLRRRDTSTVLKQALERAAINMPIQGTAADILKQAMLNLSAALRTSGYGAQMILQVHDELVLEVDEADIQPVRDLVVSTMEHAYQLDAPLVANAQVGKNWRDMDVIL